MTTMYYTETQDDLRALVKHLKPWNWKEDDPAYTHANNFWEYLPSTGSLCFGFYREDAIPFISNLKKPSIFRSLK